MNKLDSLIKEAKECCKFRGHTMTRFEHYDKGLARSTCIHCLRAVWVNDNPMPNQVDICGGAIALNC